MVFGIFKPLDIESAEINEISWSKTEKFKERDAVNGPQEFCHHLQTNNELPIISPQSSF